VGRVVNLHLDREEAEALDAMSGFLRLSSADVLKRALYAFDVIHTSMCAPPNAKFHAAFSVPLAED
jgi:hypothetical protein